MKEYYVRLYYGEDDNYNELWKSKDGKYFARHTFGIPCWYYVCDPLGYRELDFSCGEDVIFHVCDSKYKELFTSSNKKGEEFPCLRTLINEEWSKVRKDILCIEEDSSLNFYAHALFGYSVSPLDKWLLSFKDPDLCGDPAKDYEENWVMWKKEISKKTISTFNYVGIEYEVEAIQYCHDIVPDITWTEYYVAGKYKGANYDTQKQGTMYTMPDAKKMMTKCLKEIYPDVRFLSHVSKIDWCKAYKETRYSHGEAAELLIGRNLHKAYVDGLIEKEKREHSFFTNQEEMKRIYPEIILDTSYKYF